MDWSAATHALIGRHAHPIAWWQMTIRGIAIFFWGLLLIRVAGRRAFGRYTTLDIVLAVIIGSNLSRALTDNAPFFPTLTATTVLVLVYWCATHLAARSLFLGWLAKGEPTPLVRDGRIDPKAMGQTGVSIGDLEEAMREAGVAELGDVHTAVLERSGKISIIRR